VAAKVPSPFRRKSYYGSGLIRVAETASRIPSPFRSQGQLADNPSWTGVDGEGICLEVPSPLPKKDGVTPDEVELLSLLRSRPGTSKIAVSLGSIEVDGAPNVPSHAPGHK